MNCDHRPATLAIHAGNPAPRQHGAVNMPIYQSTVFEQASLSNSYAVDQSGYISFPLVGAVPARGQTTKQVEKLLADKLRRGYLRDPDVSVEVDQYRPVFVMGEVNAAGQYAYVPGLTVQKAVEAALGKGAKIDGFARFQIGK